VTPKKGDSVTLQVRVAPRSAKEEVAGYAEGVLRVRLTAPPVEGRANEALVRFLSKALGVSRGQVEVAVGERGRNKLIRIHGLPREEVYARLGVAPPPVS
jgi:uncharacterized protein (TIGR00251 family)